VDLNQFYRNDRADQYDVEIRVSATVRETITAGSVTEARDKALAMIQRGEIDVHGDDVDTAEVWSCGSRRPMYLIERPGSTITGTTHPEPDDKPRLPTAAYEQAEYTIPPTSGPLAPA